MSTHAPHHAERPRAVLALDPPSLADGLFPPDVRSRLDDAVELDPHVVTEVASPGARRRLADAEVLVAGWGAPRVPTELVPRLRAVVYAGGVAATCLADPAGLAARGVTASNARAANAVPVAEYTLAMILLANKRVHAAERTYRERRRTPDADRLLARTGNFRRTVGIVGASQVGRRVAELLRPFDLDVLVHSPELPPGPVPSMPGVRSAALEEVAARSDVLTLHQPLTPETAGMIDARVLGLLPDGATLINTARGGVVDGAALLGELRTGRIDAVLDVTDPEPPAPDDELWSLPNVVLTPHVAGSTGTELGRIGESVVAEVERFARGLEFAHPEELARWAR
ncbi:hydroxyacid dehydrogenase [Isoptericola sp. 4D.3]|uniref:Hydroxyacid dehydrogenase n=1 Tax=Isoptericola peretonis TaxID=2918523 RepID=A0ABT0J0K7_9MICO|nr:hydroxyacid dehydrogenase [Isoptericola sp. 4D.3]